jgi:polysaccharide pyruvyl transferase WcaK-like protein
MKKICIWGTSIKKVADEAQLLAVCKAIKTRIPNTEITIFARHGELIEKRYPEIKTIPTIQISKVLSSVASCDLFVVVGGPFLESRSQMISCLTLFSIAKFFRKPVITYGTTVLEYKTSWGRFFYRNLFDLMDAITVREEVGLKLLRELGVKKDLLLYPDPRFVLEPVPIAEVQNILIQEGLDVEAPKIGITTRHLHEKVPDWVKRSHNYSEDNVKNANEVIGRTVDYLGRYAQCVLIPMHPSYDEDLKTAEAIKKHMENPSRLKILSRLYRSLELIGMIGSCNMVIASRLGSAIFATVTLTPLVSIAYESRMIDHMEGIGYGQYVRDWKELNYDDFVNIAEDVWQSRDTIKDQMGSRVEEFKDRAWQNAKVISGFFEKKLSS